MLLLFFVAVAAAQTSSPKAPAGQAANACALLADVDVRTVLGMDVKERQPGTQNAHGLLLSACYLGTGTPRSVSVAIAGTTKIDGRTVTPRQFWQQQFHPREQARGGQDARGEGSTARAIPGIGDEAFWSGTRIAGVLYVLRGRTFIRVSVGGVQDEQDRIAKSRALALAALHRLPGQLPVGR